MCEHERVNLSNSVKCSIDNESDEIKPIELRHEPQYTVSWRFAQVKCSLDDAISCIEFNNNGELIAAGGKDGNIVTYKRVTTSTARNSGYKLYSRFTSFIREFDYLKSQDIEERIIKIRWLKRTNFANFLLATNEKTVKLWKISERENAFEGFNINQNSDGVINDSQNITSLRIPSIKKVPLIVEASPRRIFSNAHDYRINSISLNSDQETFLSADDLCINLWHLDVIGESFNVVNIKPTFMEDLNEVITAAEFHPIECNMFVYSTSKGAIRVCDMRSSALCDCYSKQLETLEYYKRSLIGEILNPICDVKISPSGRYVMSRNYMNIEVWDLQMENKPIEIYPVHKFLRGKLSTLFENQKVFDKFECCWSGNDSGIITGSYNNFFKIIDRESKHDVLFEATRDRMKPRALLRPCKVSTKNKLKIDETHINFINFEHRIQNTAWHPQENTIAVAAANNLFIYKDNF